MKNNSLILLLTLCTLCACGGVVSSNHTTSSRPTTSTRPYASSVDYEKVETNINDFTFVETEGGYAISRYTYKNKSTTRVVIPETFEGQKVVKINKGSFIYAVGVTKVVISKNINNIEVDSFESCDSIVSFEVSSENETYASVEGAIFSKSLDTLVYCPEGVSSFTVPSSTKHLGNNAFFRSKAKTITLNDGLKTIGDYCFARSRQVVSLDMPDSVETIGVSVFEHSNKLKNIKLSNSLKVIPMATFVYCPAINEIVIPDSVTTIDELAITDNDYLQKITFGNNVQTIGDWAVIRNTFLKEVILPSTLKSIGTSAFDSNDHLTDIVLNEGLETIGAGAFALCPNLPTLNIPSTVTTIGEGVVANDKKLSTIEVASNNANFKNEDGVLLSKDGKRLLAYPANKSGYSYSVPSTVESIDQEAFSYCVRLCYKDEAENIYGELTLPRSVKKIGIYAFSYSNNISLINYEGTVEEFKNITTSYFVGVEQVSAFDLSNVGTVKCSDGTLIINKA